MNRSTQRAYTPNEIKKLQAFSKKLNKRLTQLKENRSLFDFFSVLKKAHYLEQKHALILQSFHTYSHSYLAMQETLTETVPTLMPPFTLKQLALQHGGIILSNISKEKINPSGIEGLLSNASTEQWLKKVNQIQTLKDEEEMFSALMHFVNKQQKKDWNNLIQAKKFPQGEKIEAQPLNNTFIDNMMSMLEKTSTHSLIIQLSHQDAGTHSLGISKFHEGILFYDPNGCCIYFPRDKHG